MNLKHITITNLSLQVLVEDGEPLWAEARDVISRINQLMKDAGMSGNPEIINLDTINGGNIITTIVCRQCGTKEAITLDPDPFDRDIYGDNTPAWLCKSCRQNRADDR